MKVNELRNWLTDLGEKNKTHYEHGNRDHRAQPFAKNDELAIQTKPSTAATSPTSSRESISPRDDDLLHPSLFSERKGLDLNEDGAPTSPSTSSCSSATSPSGEIQDMFRTSSTDQETTNTPSSNASSADKADIVDEQLQDSPANDADFAAISPNPSSSSEESESLEEGAIKMNPSADPTTSTLDETVGSDEFPQAATQSWDSVLSDSLWTEEEFPAPDFSGPESYDEYDDHTGRLSVPQAESERSNDYSRRNTFGGIQGVNTMGYDHVALIRKQAPVLTSLICQEDELRSASSPNDMPTAPTMHNAKLFSNQTLTSSTLDFICNEGQVKKESDTSSSKSIVSLDKSTTSSWSNDSSKPSIAPNAIDSRMGRVLLGEHVGPSVGETMGPPKDVPDIKATDSSDQPALQTVRRKKLDPKDLPFLQSKSQSTKETEKPQPRPRSRVNTGILKFGGPRRKIVERRTEELQKLWSENKAATHVKKIQWGVCRRTGTYKKKVVIDVQYK